MFINRVKKYSGNLLLIAFLATFCVAGTANAQVSVANGSFEDFGANPTPTTGSGAFGASTIQDWYGSDTGTKVSWVTSDAAGLTGFGDGTVWATCTGSKYMYAQVGTYAGEQDVSLSMTLVARDATRIDQNIQLFTSPSNSVGAHGSDPVGWVGTGNVTLNMGDPELTLIDASNRVYRVDVTLSPGAAATQGDLIWLQLDSYWKGYTYLDEVSASVLTGSAPAFTTSTIVKANILAEEDYALLSQTLAGSAIDPDGDDLTYSLPRIGTWLTVATNGTLSGIPAIGDGGTNTFEILVEDGTGWFDKATLQIFVEPLGSAPVWSSDPVVKADGDLGAAYTGETLAGSATDADLDPLTYSLFDVGTWLSVAADGALSGTPDTVGANSFGILVEDGTGLSDTASLQIFVNAPGVAPVWSSDPVVKADGAYNGEYGLLSQTLTNDVTDADGDPLTFSKVSGPSWLLVASNGD
ncbi:MAG: Ig-like domain-containing protein, partial [Kiritimatiellaceae bacterium]|nr:Ig-like domain-containing protein [Kiritimatiellaceae bacterium]